jgi:hypothetical protein
LNKRAAVLAALLLGCGYHPLPPSGQQECAPVGTKRCPDGYQCLAANGRELCWKNGQSPPAPDSGDLPDLGWPNETEGLPDASPPDTAVDAPALETSADLAMDGFPVPPDAAADLTPDLGIDLGPAKPVCSGGYEDCDGKLENGCEANLQGDPRNCGKCGMVCPLGAGGLAAVCTRGVCGMASCSPPLMNCDGVAANGCESDTSSDVQNCGTCGGTCAAPAHGSAGCGQGKCKVASCMGAFRDCNLDFSDGCEVDSASDLRHCGACNNACPTRPNSTAVCKPSGCDIVCTAPFDSCDGDKVNGCETDLRSSKLHCGDCSKACDDPPHGVAACGNGACLVSCTGAFRDCNGQFLDGCEIDTSSSTMNCGACNAPCTAPNATVTAVACAGSACNVTACNSPQADCDKVFSNGCEVNTATDVNHCGGCNMPCPSGFVCQGTCKWTPRALGGRLALWLDASLGVTLAGSKVSGWSDQSGQGNHAAQVTDARRPTVEPNAISGRPGIKFNPLDTDNQFLTVADASSLQFGTGEFTILIVAKASKNDEDYSNFLNKQEAFAPYPGPSLWLNLPNEPPSDPAHDGKLMFQVAFNATGEAATIGHGFDSGAPFILTGRRIGLNTIRVRVNGVEADGTLGADNPSRDVSAPGRPLTIGANGNMDAQNVRASIGEIIAIKGSVSASDLAGLESYLEAKYPGLVF